MLHPVVLDFELYGRGLLDSELRRIFESLLGGSDLRADWNTHRRRARNSGRVWLASEGQKRPSTHCFLNG
jgi:hypothetical protein